MKEEHRKWHLEVLSSHKDTLYEELIHEHNITSESLKEIEFEGYDVVKGYFAIKDRKKYFIEEKVYKQLPIKAGTTILELSYKEDVVYKPQLPIQFRITPANTFPSFRDFFDDFATFNHTNKIHWDLLKFIAIQGYISKIFVCIATNPEFGKSSVYDIIDAITDMCPVFKPRSVPGVLNKITGKGNIIFDDTLEARKEVREIMEEFSLQIAGGKVSYINGAQKSKNTKAKYNCKNQSITYLYNNLDCYKESSTYFEELFDNNKAIDSRFLKMRLEGKLIEEFDRNFDIPATATNYRMNYIQIAKYLNWLQNLKLHNEYVCRFVKGSVLSLRGRRRYVYDNIVWLIDMYCEDQEEFNSYIKELDNAVMSYREMVNINEQKYEEENVE